jgi:hypothetical protein
LLAGGSRELGRGEGRLVPYHPRSLRRGGRGTGGHPCEMDFRSVLL